MDKQPIDLVQFSAQIEDVGNFHDLACAFTGHRPQKFLWGFNEKNAACAALKETLAGQIAALVDAGYYGLFRSASCRTMRRPDGVRPAAQALCSAS